MQVRPRQASCMLLQWCVQVVPQLPFQVRPTRRSWLRALDEQENVANARPDFECMSSSLDSPESRSEGCRSCLAGSGETLKFLFQGSDSCFKSRVH